VLTLVSVLLNVWLAGRRGVHPPTAMTQPVPYLLPSPPRFNGVITPGKTLESKMLVVEFWSILDIKINTFMNPVF